MNIRILFSLLCMFPIVAGAAGRSESKARVGVGRVSQSAVRGGSLNSGTKAVQTKTDVSSIEDEVSDVVEEDEVKEVKTDKVVAKKNDKKSNCRDSYRECMDNFCLLDESEGYRCACSDNINQSKSLIQEIQKIEEEASKLYTEGVERERLGAKVNLVFGESEQAKKSSLASGLNFSAWLKSEDGDDDSEDGLSADANIGDVLFDIANEYCRSELDSCADKADMEETLYSRLVVQDCKTFASYLKDQKTNANSNKRTAESAVRKARLEMLDTTNKYNRGECLLAYKSCIADKGGCGVQFENCLDTDLLGRRANACENVLNQCMAVKSYVLQDWADESESVLAEAKKYADKNQRATCLAKIQSCLEEGCSTASESMCLSDVKVAAGICPIITECNEKIPGLQSVVNEKLKYLQTKFCENDIDKCLQDRCGVNYTAPECVGKSAKTIASTMCPQSMFPSCKGATQYNAIVSAVLLQMDYQMMNGCINYFGEQLGKVCGTDMTCLPADDTVETLTEFPTKSADLAALRETVKKNASKAVDKFFKQFEKDMTVSACKDTQKPAGRASLGTSIFTSAKMVAQIGAENTALRALESKLAELSRKQDLEQAKKNCLETYKVEKGGNKTGETKSYTYIRSVNFEPDMRNCHVCRMQRVCETGGEKKSTAALKAAAGGLTAGASAGTMISAGWGTAIGGVVGAVGAGVLGAMSGGQEDYCQEIESCEDVNM